MANEDPNGSRRYGISAVGRGCQKRAASINRALSPAPWKHSATGSSPAKNFGKTARASHTVNFPRPRRQRAPEPSTIAAQPSTDPQPLIPAQINVAGTGAARRTWRFLDQGGRHYRTRGMDLAPPSRDTAAAPRTVDRLGRSSANGRRAQTNSFIDTRNSRTSLGTPRTKNDRVLAERVKSYEAALATISGGASSLPLDAALEEISFEEIEEPRDPRKQP